MRRTAHLHAGSPLTSWGCRLGEGCGHRMGRKVSAGFEPAPSVTQASRHARASLAPSGLGTPGPQLPHPQEYQGKPTVVQSTPNN